MMLDPSNIPWWGYPLVGLGVLAGLAIGIVLSIAEGASQAGESPFDRWDRMKITGRYAIARTKGLFRSVWRA